MSRLGAPRPAVGLPAFVTTPGTVAKVFRRLICPLSVVLALVALAACATGPDAAPATPSSTAGASTTTPTPPSSQPPSTDTAPTTIPVEPPSTMPTLPPPPRDLAPSTDATIAGPRNQVTPLPAAGVAVVLPPGVDPRTFTATTPRELAQQVIAAIVAAQPALGPLPDALADATALPLGPWALPDPQRRSVSCALVSHPGSLALLGDGYRVYQDTETGVGNCFVEASHGQTRVYLRLGFLAAGTPIPPPYEQVEWQRSNYAGQEVFSAANRGVLMALAVRDGLVVELVANDIPDRHGDREGLLAAMAAEVAASIDGSAVRDEIARFEALAAG